MQWIIVSLFFFDTIFMECQFKIYVGMICTGNDFNTQMLLISSNVAHNSLFLFNISNSIKLTTPKKDFKVDYIKFSYITIKNICIVKLDEGFFGELGQLMKIHLLNVTCFKGIREIHFKGLDETLTSLIINMPDLEFIEEKALIGLKNLKTLIIRHSKLKELPENLFSLSHLIKLDFSWNYLVRLPFYPLVKPLFLGDFQIFGNYWMCDCGMKIYVEFVTDPRFVQSKCFSPIRVRGLRMCDVKDMCGSYEASSNHSHDNPKMNVSSSSDKVDSKSSNTLSSTRVTTNNESTADNKILNSSNNISHPMSINLILTISALLLLLLFIIVFIIRQIFHSQQWFIGNKYKSRFISTEEL